MRIPRPSGTRLELAGRPLERAIVVLAVALLLPTTCARPQDGTNGLAIAGVSIVDVRRGTLEPGRTVVIRGSAIEAVAPDGEVSLAGMRRVDGRGRFLIPGLVDLHAHSFADEGSFRLYLANGVTTILDMGCSPECTVALRARRSAFEREGAPGPRLFFTGPNVDGASPFDYAGHVNVTADFAEAAVAELEAMGVDFIKVRDWLSLAEYDAVASAARRAGLPVIGHVAAAVPIVHALEEGQASISHSGSLLGGFLLAVSADEDELRGELLRAMESALAAGSAGAAFEMASGPSFVHRLLESFDEDKAASLTQALVKSGVVLVPTLFVLDPATASSDPIFDGRRLLDDRSMRYVPDTVLADWRTGTAPGAEGAEHHVSSFRRLMELMARFHRAGVPIFAGTDAVLDAETRWTIPGFTLHDELVLLVELGMTPAEALRAATRGPARFLGLDGVGTIEAGSAADLVLLTANPLEDIRNTRAIDAVVSNGVLFDRAALDHLLSESEPARPR